MKPLTESQLKKWIAGEQRSGSGGSLFNWSPVRIRKKYPDLYYFIKDLKTFQKKVQYYTTLLTKYFFQK
jgi:hypothetical protein